MSRPLSAIAFAAAALAGLPASAWVRVTDDAGAEVVLREPARRIVSLAPHATESLFAAGAGAQVVGTVKHADHPAEALKVPRVGDSGMIDLERIVSLRPDLLVVWLHGNSERHLEALRKLGIPMYYTRPARLHEIPDSLVRLGALAGTEAQARRTADAFSARLARLERSYAARSPVRLFFQVWEKPLLTVNGTQIISDAIRVCGGRNVFESEQLLVPTVDVEAVVRARPEAVVGTAAPEQADGFSVWRRLPAFEPTARGNLVSLRTDALGRPSPRILEGVQMLCEALEGVRRRRPA
jgi:iron complex transport system substrate-binding protein